MSLPRAPLAGRRFAGRLVFDLDESEVTETLDAPAGGVDYTIPFGLAALVEVPESGSVKVSLHGGEALALEREGDLGGRNAGLLIFANGSSKPEYVEWPEVRRIELERPKAMFPALP